MNKKIAYIISFLLISGTVVFLFYIKKKEKKESDVKDSAVISTGSDAVTTTGNKIFPLKVGSRGETVKELQRLLNQFIDLYKYPMLYLVLEQQNVDNLVVDGIFGSKTLKALQFYFRSSKTQITQDEFNLLKIKLA